MSLNALSNRAAAKVLTDIYGKEPIPFRMGGSIPVMPYIQKYLGIDTTMLAIAHGDENVHAPDEFIHLSCLEKAETAYVRLFHELAKLYKEEKESCKLEDSAGVVGKDKPEL